MKPIDFKERNVIYATSQPEYQNLPAHCTKDGVVTACWKMTWMERLTILRHGKLMISAKTFNKGLQPILPFVRRNA
jgi:hypothetical protein